MTTPEVKENFPVCTSPERESKGEAAPHHKKCGHVPIGFCGGISLSKNLCTHIGEGLRTQQLLKKKKKEKIIDQM